MTRSRALVIGQAAVTIVLLTLVLRTVDIRALRDLFARLPIGFYLGSLGVVFASQIAYAWRWRLLLTAAGVTVPFPTIVRQYFVGLFVNNFLPSSVGGDVAKVYYLGHAHGYRTVTASVVVDRLLGVGLLALLAATSLWLNPVSAPRLVAAQLATAAIAAAAILLLVVTSVGTGGLPARVARLGTGAVNAAHRLQRLRLDMAAPLGRPSVIIKATVIVLLHATAMTAVYVRFVALQNLSNPPLMAMFAAVTATAVLSNIPISLNGLGLREQLHAALLAPLGIVPEVAVAISLLLYAHLIVMSVIGLALWLRQPARAAGGASPAWARRDA